jgi:hypothetical protein
MGRNKEPAILQVMRKQLDEELKQLDEQIKKRIESQRRKKELVNIVKNQLQEITPIIKKFNEFVCEYNEVGKKDLPLALDLSDKIIEISRDILSTRSRQICDLEYIFIDYPDFSSYLNERIDSLQKEYEGSKKLLIQIREQNLYLFKQVHKLKEKKKKSLK